VTVESRGAGTEALVEHLLGSRRHALHDALGLRQVPDAEGAVERSRNETLAIGGEGDRVDRVLVALEALELLASLHVPDADHGVEGTSGNKLSIRRN